MQAQQFITENNLYFGGRRQLSVSFQFRRNSITIYLLVSWIQSTRKLVRQFTDDSVWGRKKTTLLDLRQKLCTKRTSFPKSLCLYLFAINNLVIAFLLGRLFMFIAFIAKQWYLPSINIYIIVSHLSNKCLSIFW